MKLTATMRWTNDGQRQNEDAQSIFYMYKYVTKTGPVVSGAHRASLAGETPRAACRRIYPPASLHFVSTTVLPDQEGTSKGFPSIPALRTVSRRTGHMQRLTHFHPSEHLIHGQTPQLPGIYTA